VVRLTRGAAQERTRARVLAAAREEFVARGFRAAKIDVIAERAALTRGAVYSNFPGKRALYFAVLAEEAAAAEPLSPAPVAMAEEALGAFARAWLARLPLATEQGHPLDADLIPEVVADERVRRPYAQLMTLDALVLGLALENLDPGGRRVRVAETALTLLHGASRMAGAAPGFGEPFDVVAACERLAGLAPDDGWRPPHLPFVAPARPVDEPAAEEFADGVVAVLGLHRLDALEEAVRSGLPVTAVLVTGSPEELGALARLTLAEMRWLLRSSFPDAAAPAVRIVLDLSGKVAAAAGVSAVSDATEVAVRVAGDRIVARAEGRGACHAVAR
jgi:AcrR family transcriptional regulator